MQNTACFQTTNPDQFGEFIQIALPTDLNVSTYRRRNFYVDTTTIKLFHTGLFKVSASDLKAQDSGTRKFVSVTIPLNGEISFLDGIRYRPYTQGAANIIWKNEALDLHIRSSSNLVINFDYRELLANWCKLFGSSDFGALEKKCFLSLHTSKAAEFWCFLASAYSSLSTTPMLFNAEKAIQELENNLMTLFLLAIDEQTNPENSEKHSHQKVSIAIANADDYISANLSRPVSIADIAQAANLHPRTLFRAFNKKTWHGAGNFLETEATGSCSKVAVGRRPGVRDNNATCDKLWF